MKKIGNAIYIRQRLVCVLTCLFITILFCAGFSLHARAAEKDENQEAANVQGNLMAAAVDTVGLEQPKEGAASVVKLQAGTHLLVVGEETNGWCEIYYQGKTAFVPAADMTAATLLDAEALDQFTTVIPNRSVGVPRCIPIGCTGRCILKSAMRICVSDTMRIHVMPSGIRSGCTLPLRAG